MSIQAYAASLGGKMVDYGIGKLVQKSNLDDSKEIARFNDALQRRLIADSPALQKAGMQKAGLSVAALNGSFQSVSNSSQAATPKMDAPQGVDFLTASNLAAQNRLIEAQADAQELANDKERDYQDAVYMRGESVNEYIDTKTGKTLTAAEYKKLPAKVRNEQGRFELQKVQPARRSIAAYAVKSEIAKVTADTVRYNLERSVNNLKLDDAEVKTALSRMDKAQFDNLVQAGKVMLQDEDIKRLAANLARLTQQDNVDKNKIEREMLELEKEIQKFNFDVSKKTDISKSWTEMTSNLSWSTFSSFIGSIIVTLVNSAASAGGAAAIGRVFK